MANNVTVAIELELEVGTCTHPGCGIAFGVPPRVIEELRRTHATFYCPFGHPRHFPGKSEEEKLREELASARGNERFYRERAERERVAAETARRSAAAQRGVKTRILNRVKAGICPFCSRRFDSLGIHVRAEHGDEVAQELAEETAAP